MAATKAKDNGSNEGDKEIVDNINYPCTSDIKFSAIIKKIYHIR
jgi:hypothetical protein